MAKAYNAVVYDNGLNYFKNNCDKIIVTDGVPNINDYAATVGMKAAEASVTAATFTIAANGAGRKISHGAVDGTVTASTSGNNDLHIAYLDTTNSTVLAITDETTNQPLTAGNPVTFPPIEYKFNAPV